MPRQTRKQKAGNVEKPKRRPVKKRPAPKVKPSFKPEPPPRELPVVTRVRCPLCGMMTEYEDFLKTDSPQLQFYEQRFGGRQPAPRGTKPGQRSKLAPGFMEYKEVTDPSSPEYQEIAKVIKERIGNIGENLTQSVALPIMQKKRRPKRIK